MILLDANFQHGCKVIHSHRTVDPGHVTRRRRAAATRSGQRFVPPSNEMVTCSHVLSIVNLPPTSAISNRPALINGSKMALNVSLSKSASLVNGPTAEPLWNITLGDLIKRQASKYEDRTALVFPRQNIRRTYRDLLVRSRLVSKALIEQGLESGDCVGIFAGNCCEYVEVFLGAGAIGCPVVVLNAGYTPTELRDAIMYSGKSNRSDSAANDSDSILLRMQSAVCRAFPGTKEGRNATSGPHCTGCGRDPDYPLRRRKRSGSETRRNDPLRFFTRAREIKSVERLRAEFKTTAHSAKRYIKSSVHLRLGIACDSPLYTFQELTDVGTTGVPKAAMLSHM